MLVWARVYSIKIILSNNGCKKKCRKRVDRNGNIMYHYNSQEKHRRAKQIIASESNFLATIECENVVL